MRGRPGKHRMPPAAEWTKQTPTAQTAGRHAGRKSTASGRVHRRGPTPQTRCGLGKAVTAGWADLAAVGRVAVTADTEDFRPLTYRFLTRPLLAQV